MPSRNFQVIDYGVQDEWCGGAPGIRAITKRVIKRSLDWTKLRPLTPARGALSQQVECLRLICGALESDNVPVLQTIYSPLTQAAQLAGSQRLLRDMRVRPDRLRSGLNHLTESTLRFLESLLKLPRLAGIFIVTELASHDIMSEAEYAEFGLPQLETIRSYMPEHLWLNIVQVAGSSPMLKPLGGLQFQAYNWDVGAGSTDLPQAMSLYDGATCGGLNDQQELLRGTPSLLQASMRDTLEHAINAASFCLAAARAGYDADFQYPRHTQHGRAISITVSLRVIAGTARGRKLKPYLGPALVPSWIA